MLSPHAGVRSAVVPHTRGTPSDSNGDNTLVLFPAGRLSTPPGSGQTGLMEIDSLHQQTNLLTEGQRRAESEIRAFMPHSQISSLPFTREHVRAQSDSRGGSLPDIPPSVAEKAYDEMLGAVDDIKSLVQGYSYYFLEGDLAFLKGNAIAVPPDQLQRILQTLSGIISMGPRGEIDRENGDMFASLTNDSWCRLVMALLGAILRGCTRTRDLPSRCNFELGSEDDFDIDDQLRKPATQLEAIQFMIAQLNEQFLPNAHGLPAPRVEEICTRIWAKLEDALRAELEAEAAVFRSRISDMGISDIFEQIMSGVSRQELTETMREEIQLEERSRFRNLLLAARREATDYALAEAVADGQAEADILCAEDRAELAEYKRLQAKELERRKAKIRDDTEREATDFRKSTEELLAQSGIDQCCKELDSIVRAQSNKAELEFVRDHAIRLGLISRDDVAKPSAKRVRVEPRSHTVTQTASQVRSRSASISSESWKRTHSASPPTASKPTDMTSTPVPSSAPMEEDDLTPTASPSVALPPAQRVETTILSSVPERNLASSMHAPGNEMVDDSIEPTTAHHPAPDSGAKPDLSDDVTSRILDVMFTALRQHLAPINASIERLSNIVDGRTPPCHATSAKPPSATTLPYLKQTSGRADSGGRNGSPQGEENDSGRPSSGVPRNPNPISTQEASGETRATEDTPGQPKLGRKARKTQAIKAANTAIPGAALPPTDGHITLQHARIAPTFVQVATANTMRQQDKAQGFRVAASSAQNRKASGAPQRGQALTPQGATEVTIIRYGGLGDCNGHYNRKPDLGGCGMWWNVSGT